MRIEDSIKEFDKASVEKGKVSFLWFNDYAGVAIKTPFSTIVIDPTFIPPTSFEKVDVLVVTHDHYDHFEKSVVKGIHERTKCIVVADPTSAEAMSDVVSKNKLKEVKVGDSVVIGRLTIFAEKSNHPPALTPLSFVIETEEGIRLYHTSDSLDFPEMKDIGNKYRPDIAFCTVGIAPGASPRTGAEIAKLVRPKLSIPYHTKTKSQLEEFATILERESPELKFKIIEKGKIYHYP